MKNNKKLKEICKINRWNNSNNKSLGIYMF